MFSKHVCAHSCKTTIIYNSLKFRNKNNSHIKEPYTLMPFFLIFLLSQTSVHFPKVVSLTSASVRRYDYLLQAVLDFVNVFSSFSLDLRSELSILFGMVTHRVLRGTNLTNLCFKYKPYILMIVLKKNIEF